LTFLLLHLRRHTVSKRNRAGENLIEPGVADNPDPQADAVPVTSSEPVTLPEKQGLLFQEVLLTLGEKDVPFVVAGAFALQEHTGICRWTKDLDIFLTAENAAVALRHLASRGFDCEVRDPVWLYKAHRDDFFVDLITGMSNGVIFVDDTWIERGKPAIVYGVSTRVLAPEELIASKIFVIRRERFDGADIAHVVYGTGGNLDWDRLLVLAGEHWELLLWALVLFRYVYPGQTHYVPPDVWNTLLERFNKEITNPNLNAKFRGSLVDDHMFAVDVNDWGLENVLEEYRSNRLSHLTPASGRVEAEPQPQRPK
jgi:Nucleotidyl transferase of unknown function (DUF2204)